MEVHPPEHSIHTWRDFFVHMGTITLGLVIALALEAAVEAWHHHNELVEARERIHTELEQNAHTIAEDRQRVEHAMTNMRANLAIIDAPGALNTTRLRFGWVWNDPMSSAWDTAKANGAVSLMSYDELQGYSEDYLQQEAVKEAAKDYIAMQVKLVTPLMRRGDLQNGTVAATLSPEERTMLADRCAESLTQMGLLIDLTNGLNKLYAGSGVGK